MSFFPGLHFLHAPFNLFPFSPFLNLTLISLTQIVHTHTHTKPHRNGKHCISSLNYSYKELSLSDNIKLLLPCHLLSDCLIITGRKTNME